MKKMYQSIPVLLFTWFFLQSAAQQPFNFISAPTSSQNISVVSQVNQFTGKFGFSVPIYSFVSSRSNLKFSISVDYASGSVNLNQDPSAVGTGWNLSAGGLIHREINGLPDDITRQTPSGYNVSGFINTPEITSPPCGYQYRSVGYYDNTDSKVGQDSEPDDFSFSFLGNSGSFNIPKGGLFVNGPKIITKPNSNLEFNFYVSNNPWPVKTDIREIKITDDMGVEYLFTAIQTTGRMKSRAVQNSAYEYHFEYDYLWEDYVTDWLLTKITDINSGEEINLTYETYYCKTKLPVNVSYYSKLGSPTFTKRFIDDRHHEDWGKSQRLKNVDISNGDRIDFIYDSNNRCDLLNDKALLAIKIKSITNNEINFGFVYSYFQGTSEINYNQCTSSTEEESLKKWLFLKEVRRLRNSDWATIASFEYIISSDIVFGNDNKLPFRKTLDPLNVSKGMYNKDIWGFYKGEPIEPCPTCYCPYVDCNLTPSLGYPEIGNLKKINYANGGSLNIEYEANKINKNGFDQISYGVRVKKLKESDGINPLNDLIKNYNYIRSNGNSSGFAMELPPRSYTNEMKSGSSIDNYSIVEVFGVAALEPINGSPEAYHRVEEETITGKIVSEFTGFDDYSPLNTTYVYPFAKKQRIADWAYGLLKKKSVLNINGNTVRTTENTFDIPVNYLTSPIYSSMKTAYQRESESIVIGLTTESSACATNDSYWKFKYDSYQPVTGRSELRSVIEKNFLKDGSIITNKVDYDYDANTFNLKKTTTFNSKNEKIEKHLFYPIDYSSNSNPYKLIQRGIIGAPVSSISILTKPTGDKYISGFEKTEFQQLTDFSIRADKILSLKTNKIISIPANKTVFTPEEYYGEATDKLTIDMQYEKYDNVGNIKQTNEKGIIQSVIWDAEQGVIVANANAPSDDIAYSSFETNEKGNWIYTGANLYNVSSPTGKKVFELILGSNNISKTNLNSSKTYVVSYWSNTGSYLVNNNATAIVTGASYNGWTYYKHKISGVNTVTISGNGLIDELKINPMNSRMTSITYQPLVGVTSESGIDGQITKYTYDSFGRLLNIKDEAGNISKIFCYNSNGRPSDCGDSYIFRNFATPYTLYNNNCPPGTTSNAIQYSVPTGRYISFISQDDANDQAFLDVQTYGQAIADRTANACIQTTVYARLTYENYYGSGTSGTGDVVVRFYSDASGTQPLFVNNLTLNFMEHVYYDYDHQEYDTNLSQTVSGSVVTLASNVLFYWQDYECDYGSWPCYYYTNTRDYYISANSNYQIIY